MLKIYYQDFTKNTFRTFTEQKLFFDSDKAVYICTLAFPVKTKKEAAALSFRELNITPLQEQDAIYRKRFKDAGHTSMSIGDYIVFEDREIWICKDVGWELIHRK